MDTATLDRISFLIIQAAIEIHKALGPGLLESTYRICMIYELKRRNLKVISELRLPVRYKDLVMDSSYRLDLLVEEAVIVELKAIEKVLPIHRAQVLTYLRHTDRQLGLILNFNVERLVLGIERIVNNFGLPRSLRSTSRDIPTDSPSSGFADAAGSALAGRSSPKA
jgi:GxxExxY protein